MGIVKVTIGVGDPQGRTFEEIEVTVDTRNTGSTYTAVPRELLRRLGVPVERSLPSETADGRVVPVDVGNTIIRLEGREFHTPVIFAEEGEPSPAGHGIPGGSRPCCRPSGRATDTVNPATHLKGETEGQVRGNQRRVPNGRGMSPGPAPRTSQRESDDRPGRLHRRCYNLDIRQQRLLKPPQQPTIPESNQDS